MAGSGDYTRSNLLTEDTSVQILIDVFGDAVASMLGETDASTVLFESLMQSFNTLLICFLFLLFAYILFAGTVNTANDGMFLGRKWNSTWMPLRFVFGSVLVIPIKSGYCIAQYLMFYVIIAGVAVASGVWEAIVDDIDNDYTPPTVSYKLREAIIGSLGKILLSYQANEIISDLYSSNSGNSYAGQYLFHSVADFATVCSTSSSGSTDLVSILTEVGICTSDGGYNTENAERFLLKATNYRGVNHINGSPINFYTAVSSGEAINEAWLERWTGFGSTAYCDDASTCGTSTLISSAQETIEDKAKSFTGSGAKTGITELLKAVGSKIKSVKNNGVSVTASDVENKMYNNLLSAAYQQGLCSDLSSTTSDFNAATAESACMKGFTAMVTNGDNSDTQGYWYIPRTHYSDFPYCSYDSPMCDSSTEENNYYVTFNMSDEPDESLVYALIFGYAPSLRQIARGGSLTDYELWKTYMGMIAIGEDTNVDDSTTPVSDIYTDITPGSDVTKMYEGTCFTVDGVLDSCSSSVNTYLYNGIDTIITELEDAVQEEGTSLSDFQTFFFNTVNEENDTYCSITNLAIGGWWCAGTNYITLEENLASILRVVYFNLYRILMHSSTFSSAATGSISLDLDYQVTYFDYNDYASNGCDSSGSDLPWDPTCSNSGYGTNSEIESSSVIPDGSYSTLTLDFIGYLSDYTDISEWSYLIKMVAKTGLENGIDGILPLTKFLEHLGNDFRSPVQAIFWTRFYLGLDIIDQTLTNQLLDVFYTLQNNGVNYYGLIGYNGSSDDIAYSSATAAALDEIFDNLLGSSYNNDGGETAEKITTNITSVLSELYEFGSTDVTLSTSSVSYYVDEQYNLLAQALVLGIDLITVVLDSFGQIYSYYYDAIQDIVKAAEKSINGTLETVAEFFPFMMTTFTSSVAIAEAQTTVDFAELGITLMWLPLALFVLVSLFTSGISFAIILPMTPFILFWSGQVGWLLLCIEAVVAAPIVALGLVVPDGHDVFGQATPALRLALNLFLRPVLLIIGLVTGMILTYIIITFSAESFHLVTTSVLDMVPSTTSIMVSGVLTTFLILMYSSFLVMAFNKCFSVIYMIPDRVLRWVGAQAEGSDAAQDLQQMSGAMNSAAKDFGSASGQSLEKGISAQSEAGKAKGNEGYTDARATAQQYSSYSSAAWEGAALMV